MTEAAHRLALRQRHQVIDGRDHAVPVADQIERDHRCDDHQRKDRNQSLALAPKRRQKSGQIAGGLIQQIADRFIGTDEIVADDTLDPRMVRIADQRFQTLRIAGRVFDEAGQLPRENRCDDQRQEHNGNDKAAEDNEGCDQPAHAALGQPFGQRVEDIGDGHAEHERQQNGAEQPQKEDGDEERHDPEHDVALHCPPPYRRCNQCPAPNEFIWRTHSAR